MSASTPLLIVTAGPARGRSIAVEGTLSIGRDPANALPIGDPALSRQHCVVEASNREIVIRDLASRNGVFVNGSPVRARTLADGDQIRIGDSALVLMIPDVDRAPHPPGLALDDARLDVASTVAIAAAHKWYASPEPGGVTATSNELSLLLRVSEELQRAATLDEFARVLLTAATAGIGAQSAALLSRADEGDWRVQSQQPEAGRFVAHAPLADRVVKERVAALAADGSSLYAPIDAETVLWLNVPAGNRFADHHLQIAASIASVAALALDRLRHLQWLRAENVRLHHAAIKHDLIGESRAMQSVLRFIERAAPTDATVLLRGESGTGKELIAKAIHANSGRAHGPFVAINCAALPEALLESELFGHERGAFTGALSQQRGRLEIANGGTVFLDEIGELAPTLQAKLLRGLQERSVERVGGRRPIDLDIRVIAATNRDLEKAMTAGAFRQDLFYRLNVVSLEVPPLRDRRDDIPLLAAYFVKEHAARCKRTVRGIAAPAREMLLRYEWPGNVRELSNVIERAVVLGASEVILPDDFPDAVIDATSNDEPGSGFHDRVSAARRAIIREALERHNGNVAAAARDLDLQVTYLHRLIRNLNVGKYPSTS